MTNPLDLLRAAEFSEIRRDPISEHLFSSTYARDFFKSVIEGTETYLRSGNRAGKTSIGSYLGACLALGVRKVDARTIFEARDGVPQTFLHLPHFKAPNLGILIVPSYKQAMESSVAYYRKWFAGRKVKLLKGAMGLVTEMRVQPLTSTQDDDDEWSKIMIFPRDGELPRGIAPLWIHADEPPSHETWGEARARRAAGRKLLRWITATPEKREEWEWLRADYKEPTDWKREITMSVYDNQALSKAELDSIEREWANDPIKEARYFGAYVDLTGANPFKPQIPLIKLGLDAAKEPIREERVQVKVEEYVNTGVEVQDAYGTVYVWEDPKKGETYYVLGDPSLGVADDDHDPCGMHVYTEGLNGGPVRMVARYNGYIGAYGLGWLMAIYGERYGGAVVSPDMTGGYGGPVLTALSNYRSREYPNGYPFIASAPQATEPGEWKQPYGFTMDAIGKAEMIECIRWAVVNRSVLIPSAATWRCLLETVMDKRGRLLKPKGVHYEDLVLLGHQCFRHFALERKLGADVHSEAQKVRRAEAAGAGLMGSMPWSRGS